MHDRDELEKKYQRHLDRLRTKKAKEAFIKSPVPSNPDRCFVCNCILPPDQPYKAHLESEEHRGHIEVNYLYQEIDKFINEMQLDNEIKVIAKNKKQEAPSPPMDIISMEVVCAAPIPKRRPHIKRVNNEMCINQTDVIYEDPEENSEREKNV